MQDCRYLRLFSSLSLSHIVYWNDLAILTTFVFRWRVSLFVLFYINVIQHNKNLAGRQLIDSNPIISINKSNEHQEAATSQPRVKVVLRQSSSSHLFINLSSIRRISHANISMKYTPHPKQPCSSRIFQTSIVKDLFEYTWNDAIHRIYSSWAYCS